MTRTVYFACLFLFACAPRAFSEPGKSPEWQVQQRTQPKSAQQPPDESEPPEEDESVAPEKFVLNPLESDRNIRVGNYYWHKGNYRAALGRYERAARFNPSSAEAFFKVGEAEEKLKNRDAAKTAFEKVIQLAPDSKLAHDARKKIESKS